MNQGKLKVVKQKMARVNIYILGISELKWTGMGEFNSDNHYNYDCGQESLRSNGVALVCLLRSFNGPEPGSPELSDKKLKERERG